MKLIYVSLGAIYLFSGVVTFLTIRKTDIKNVTTYFLFCLACGLYAINSFVALEDHDIIYFYFGPILGFISWPLYINLINDHFKIKPLFSIITKYTCYFASSVYTIFLIYYLMTGKGILFWPIELRSTNIFFQTIGFSIDNAPLDFVFLGIAITSIFAASIGYTRILFPYRKKETLLFSGIIISFLCAVSDSVFASDASDFLLPVASFGFLLEVTRFYIVFQRKNLDKIQNLEGEIFNMASLAELGTYTAGITHDIRNPLQIIMISAQNILRTNPEDTTALRINKNANKINEIINTYIGLIKRKENESSKFNLNQLISDSFESCKGKISYHQIKTSNNCPQEIEATQSSSSLFVALSNLISNSADAIKDLEEKEISVDCEVQKGNLTIFISDSGKGIPEEIVPRLFERTFTTKGQAGTGLGLYLVKNITESELHGTIQYKKLNDHTCFIITIPLNL